MSSCGLEQGSKTEWLIPRRLGIFSPRQARLELGKLKIINYTTWWQTITGRGTCCRGLLTTDLLILNETMTLCRTSADLCRLAKGWCNICLIPAFSTRCVSLCDNAKAPRQPSIIQQQCYQQSMLIFYLISELRTQQSNRLTAGPAATDQTLKWFKNAPSCSQPKVSKLKSVLSIVRFTLETLTNFKI